MRLEILRRESYRTVAIIQRTFLPISHVVKDQNVGTPLHQNNQLGVMDVHQKIVKDCKNHGQMFHYLTHPHVPTAIRFAATAYRSFLNDHGFRKSSPALDGDRWGLLGSFA